MGDWLLVVLCAGCFLCLAVCATVTVYICARSWQLYRRIRAAEARLSIVDAKILTLLNSLDRQLVLRTLEQLAKSKPTS